MQTSETCVLISRLVIAGVLGGLIGAEREYRAKTAGMRTHVLVAIGAARSSSSPCCINSLVEVLVKSAERKKGFVS